MDSTIPLLLSSEISKLQPSSVTVQAGFCWIWSEIQIVGFLKHRFIFNFSPGSDSDVETSESSEEIHQELTEDQVKALRAKIAKMHHKAAHDHHIHHKHVHHEGESSEEMESEEDEEEIDSELFDSEDEELIKVSD